MDCAFQRNSDGLWTCQHKSCKWVYPHKSEKPPRRNCKANIPTRTEPELLDILTTHCEPCMFAYNGKCYYNSCVGNPCGASCRRIAEQGECPDGKFSRPEAETESES